MSVEADIYAKFGGTADRKGDPDFQGDSTDDGHYFWSELRSCNLGLEREGQDPSQSQGKGSPTGAGQAKQQKVTFNKKVDWASPSLFEQCSAAGKASEGSKDGTIENILVEFCRTANGEKFPLLTILYKKVTVTAYEITMQNNEAVETLELDVTSYEYGFQQTKASTGEKDGDLQTFRSPDPKGGSGGGGGGSSGGSALEDEDPALHEEGGASAARGAGVTVVGAAGSALGGSAGMPALVSAHDESVRTNFPGLDDDVGFGLLPD